MSIQLEVIPDDQWADRVVATWAAHMEEKPTARLCLPTGQTPRPLYARAAQSIEFGQATVFLLDEFGLPPGDPARCDAMLQRDLLAGLAQPPALVHTLDVQAANPVEECRRFENLVDDGGLDLTLLGLGGNGHVGLNEPGTNAKAPTRVVRLAPATRVAAERYGSDHQPVWGMTVGLRPILDSREIWLLVTGSKKAAILQRMLHGPVGPALPASFLRTHPNTVVFADQSAAQLL